jgi:hypothetical protein
MIVVIQCAAKKHPRAGYLRVADGKRVLFVADPATAPAQDGIVFARPDDVGEQGVPWRQSLVNYNKTPDHNPFGLMPAWRLYGNRTYEMLFATYGEGRLYILSAGWGLISANFLTPMYDITFSASAEKYKRRRKSDEYNDLKMLPSTICEPIIFLGGKDYVELFCNLTNSVRAERTIFYNSASPPTAPDCILKRYMTKTRTNWHYECARALAVGSIGI